MSGQRRDESIDGDGAIGSDNDPDAPFEIDARDLGAEVVQPSEHGG